jgi:hypothetical protein
MVLQEAAAGASNEEPITTLKTPFHQWSGKLDILGLEEFSMSTYVS